MKNNYRISVFRNDGNLVAFDSYCSRYQAERAFYALCFMLNQKPYRSIRLSLVTSKGLEVLENCEVKNA